VTEDVSTRCETTSGRLTPLGRDWHLQARTAADDVACRVRTGWGSVRPPAPWPSEV